MDDVTALRDALHDPLCQFPKPHGCHVYAALDRLIAAVEARAARRAIEGSGAVEADELLELLIGILAEGPNGEYATIDAMERAAKTIHMEWHEAQGRWVTTDRTRPYRAARRALEGSGVVEAVEATRTLPDDAPNWRTDKANLYAAGWIDRGDAILAALPRPEEPRVPEHDHFWSPPNPDGRVQCAFCDIYRTPEAP